MENEAQRILTINSGSSSIKFSLYEIGNTENLILSGKLDRIGLEAGLFQAGDSNGGLIAAENLRLPDHIAALKRLFEWLAENQMGGAEISAIGHRVVHGGSKYNKTRLIDHEMMLALIKLIPFAPEHLPHEIKAIDAVSRVYPDCPQVACFDTAFHRDMPRLAQSFPLTRELFEEGIIRYGFHGLSYEFIMNELEENIGIEASKGNIIIAHLGNGASMAAVKNGKAFDTTMGFTPTGGLMMSTRSGDLDPGAVIYLMKEKGMSADEINELLNKKSGLMGMSGISSDVRDLLEKEKEDARAKEALDLFCYQARKFTGSFASALGGLNTLIFTAGIGENSPVIRERICAGLSFMGIHIDEKLNKENAPVISAVDSFVTVRVMRTNEELMIAKQTARLTKELP